MGLGSIKKCWKSKVYSVLRSPPPSSEREIGVVVAEKILRNQSSIWYIRIAKLNHWEIRKKWEMSPAGGGFRGWNFKYSC